MTTTKTVELRRGYVDPDGNYHRTAVLTLPTIDDQIAAERDVIQLAADREDAALRLSDVLIEAALLARCTVQLGAIPDPTLEHIRALRRYDYIALRGALQVLEDEDEAAQLAEGKSSSAA
ncbi:MAG: hypothetical protein AAGI01_05485 [Myxococcota bacterium]